MIRGGPAPRAGLHGPILLSAVAYGLAVAAGGRIEAEVRGPIQEAPLPQAGPIPVPTPPPVEAAPASAAEDCLPRVEVRFPSASSVLVPPEIRQLEPLLRVVRAHPGRSVIVEGHTDGRGTAADNLKLSHTRALRVGGWLVKHGLARELLTIRAFGPYQPRTDGDGDEGDNRRVVVRVEGIPACGEEGGDQ